MNTMTADLMKQIMLSTKLYLMKHDFVQIAKVQGTTHWRRKTDGMIVAVAQKPDGSISISLDPTKTKGKTAENKARREMLKTELPSLDMLRRN